MGLIFDFFKDINDEVNRGIARDKADIICEQAYEYLTNNEYPPEEIFVRNGKGSPPFMLFESKDINNLACLTLVAALTKGMENRENSVSFESIFSEVFGVYNHMAEMELTNLDLENKKEYLSNKEFLEKYNFTDESYEFIDAMKEALKIEVTRMAAICSYIDTIIHFSELFNEYFSNFEKEGKIQNPIYYLPFDYSFEWSVTRIIKEAFFMYQYRNMSYFENNMGEIEDLSDNHPKSEIENPYSMYRPERYYHEDRYFHPYSYKELEKEFELFYIEDDMEAIRDFSQGLRKSLTKRFLPTALP